MAWSNSPARRLQLLRQAQCLPLLQPQAVQLAKQPTCDLYCTQRCFDIIKPAFTYLVTAPPVYIHAPAAAAAASEASDGAGGGVVVQRGADLFYFGKHRSVEVCRSRHRCTLLCTGH